MTNFLVTLDAQAGELEKILSGTKCMLLKEIDLARTNEHPVHSGDSLFFRRSQEECTLRVKATILRVESSTNDKGDDLTQILKGMQPKLQLTEAQYNYWSAKEQVLLVEFTSAQKIGPIQIVPQKMDSTNWMAFTELETNL